MADKKISKLFIYLIAFVEGAALLVAEICSAKFIESQIGISLYVWASVLSMTLIGLALGYFIGGRLSKNASPKINLFLYLMIGGAFLLLMPVLSYLSLGMFQGLSAIWTSLLSAFVFLLTPITMLGCISPTLIQLASTEESAGRIAGEIFSISTIAGVVSILFSVLFLIPLVGLSYTCWLFGSLLIVMAILVGIAGSKLKQGIGVLIIIGSLFLNGSQLSSEHQIEQIYESSGLFQNAQLNSFNELSHKTGLYGTVRVVDFNVNYSGVQGNVRALLVNNTVQTLITMPQGQAMLGYVYMMEGIFNAFPSYKDILHIGLGGGIVSTRLSQQGREVTAVEIDHNVTDAAKDYFNLSPSVNIVNNDGRNFINGTDKQFDIIVLNVFNSGIPPWNLYTKESFEKCYEVVSDNGLMVIELGGIITENSDPILSSVIKTIQEAGWNTALFKTDFSDKGDYICLAHKSDAIDISNWTYNNGGSQVYIVNMQIPDAQLNKQEAIIFTDDNPILTKWASERIR